MRTFVPIIENKARRIPRGRVKRAASPLCTTPSAAGQQPAEDGAVFYDRKDEQVLKVTAAGTISLSFFVPMRKKV